MAEAIRIPNELTDRIASVLMIKYTT